MAAWRFYRALLFLCSFYCVAPQPFFDRVTLPVDVGIHGAGVTFHKVDEFFLGAVVGVQEHLQPFQLFREVLHIAKLQGGGNVMPKVLNACIQFFGADGQGGQF